MSIFKKVIKLVKRIFKGTSVRKRKSKNKIKASRRFSKKKSLIVKRKSTKIDASSKTRQTHPKIKPASSPKVNLTSLKKKISHTAFPVGEVTHYFDKIKVCVVRIDHGVLRKGDRILIEGKHGGLRQVISSMQVENADVSMAKEGQLIGLKVSKPVYAGDLVTKS